MDDDANQQALLSALVTEHFVLQSARGVATSEAASRAALYLTFLSGALIALGFIAQVAERFDTFAAAVLPAIVVLGEFTYVRLLENSIEDVLFQRRINRIRRWYLGLHPDAAQFFGDILRDTRSSPVAMILRTWTRTRCRPVVHSGSTGHGDALTVRLPMRDRFHLLGRPVQSRSREQADGTPDRRCWCSHGVDRPSTGRNQHGPATSWAEREPDGSTGGTNTNTTGGRCDRPQGVGRPLRGGVDRTGR